MSKALPMNKINEARKKRLPKVTNKKIIFMRKTNNNNRKKNQFNEYTC